MEYTIFSGITSDGITLNFRDILYVYSAGTAENTTVKYSGDMIVFSGGTAIDTTLRGSLDVEGVAQKITVNSFGRINLRSGGTASDISINDMGELYVFSGGSATNIDWTPCMGDIWIEGPFTYVTFVSQYSGVYYRPNELLHEMVMESQIVSSNTMYVMSGGVANSTTVSWMGIINVSSGGTVNNTIVDAYGRLNVSSGGIANNTVANYGSNGGYISIESGATVNNTTINSGTRVDISYGAIAKGTIINSGELNVFLNGVANSTTVNPGGLLDVNNAEAYDIRENGGAVQFNYANTTFVNNSFSGLILSDYATVHSGTTAIRTTVNSNGSLSIYSGGIATQIIENGGKVYYEEGAEVTFASNTFSGVIVPDYGWATVHSGTTAYGTILSSFDADMIVHSGGSAFRTTVGQNCRLFISNDGIANDIIENGGNVIIEDGAIVSFASNSFSEFEFSGTSATLHSGTTANSTVVNNNGKLDVSGGKVIGTILNSGTLNVSSLGMASETIINSRGSMFVSSGGTTINTTLDSGGIFDIAKGAIVKSTTINSGASLAVSKDVAVYNTVVYENGELHICSGGTACNTKVFAAGRVKVLSGGTLTGKMNYMAGAIVSIENGAILDFDLTQTAAGGKAILSDWSLIQGTPDYVLTVGTSQASGIYKLADNADEFDGTLSVRDTAGESFGTLAVGGALAVGKAAYTLTLDDESLVLTITGGAKPDTQAPTISNIRASTTKQTDQAVTVTAVFADDIALKSSLYKLGENGIWKDYVNGVTVTENMTIYFKAVDVAGNESKIASYKVANIKKAEPDSPSGTPDNGRNNWLYLKTLGVNPDLGDFVATDVSASTEEIPLDRDGDVDSEEWQNYVGYDDLADFARINLENDAKLSFLANATGAAKLVIYRLTEGTGKKAGTYTMKVLQTTTLKKPKWSTEYTAETKGLLLVAGDYYIAMKSTGSKKGGTAYYNVNLNEKSAFFTNGDGGWNNWLYEKKTGPNPNSDDFITTVISSSTEEIQLDRDGDVDSFDWLNFVGYGDAADYAKIVLNGEAKLSFLILATDAAKFVIYRLTEKISKKGVVTYSKKTLQTTKLKKDKQTQMYEANTKALKLGAGEYFISVQSTNAKQGGNAYYSVNLNEERSWFSEALLDTKVADALECDNTFDREEDLFATGLENMLDDSQSVRLDIANLA